MYKNIFCLLIAICCPYVLCSQSKKEQIKTLQNSVNNLTILLDNEHQNNLVKDSVINVLNDLLSKELQDNILKDSIILVLEDKTKALEVKIKVLEDRINVLNIQKDDNANVKEEVTKQSKQEFTNKNDEDLGFGDNYNKDYSGGDANLSELRITKGKGLDDTLDASGRIRLNEPDLSGIMVKTDNNAISLILTIDKNGNVTKVDLDQSRTTIAEASVINKVKNIVKSEVKYNKVSYDNPARVYLTIYIKIM